MVIEEYSIERINLPGYAPAEYQVKFYMEAPQDGTISRDFFVGFSAYYGITILQTMLAEGYEVSAATFLGGIRIRRPRRAYRNAGSRNQRNHDG